MSPPLSLPARPLPRLIYRRLTDSALGVPDRLVLHEPLPGNYRVLAEGQAPPSLPALLRNHRTFFIPNANDPSCRPMVVDSWSTVLARVHDDEDGPALEGDECRLRYLSGLEYSPGRWGEASILIHDEGERILRGCAGFGSGIALCGEPDLRIVSADARRIVLVDERGLPGRNWVVHAYAEDTAVTWYFDRRDCVESVARRAMGGCSD